MSSFLITHLPPNKDSSKLVEFLIRNDFVFTFGQTPDELTSWVRAKDLIYSESQKSKTRMISLEGEIRDDKPKDVIISPKRLLPPVVNGFKPRIVAPALAERFLPYARPQPVQEKTEPTFLAPRNRVPPLKLRDDYTPAHGKYTVRTHPGVTSARIVYRVQPPAPAPPPPQEEEKPPVLEKEDLSFMRGSKHAELLMQEDDEDEEMIVFDETNNLEMALNSDPSCSYREVSPTSYKCPISDCGIEFTRQNVFMEHMDLHPGEQPFRCNECGKGYSQSGSLNRHMRIHTGETPYWCSYCEKKFNHPEQLKCHLRTHTGEKPYECNVCQKRFTQSHSLKEHLRLHTGEKPYECSYCKKRFNHLGTLQKHVRVHTGERPFECRVCEKKFKQSAYLKQHLWVIHGEVNNASNGSGSGAAGGP